MTTAACHFLVPPAVCQGPGRETEASWVCFGCKTSPRCDAEVPRHLVISTGQLETGPWRCEGLSELLRKEQGQAGPGVRQPWPE